MSVEGQKGQKQNRNGRKRDAGPKAQHNYYIVGLFETTGLSSSNPNDIHYYMDYECLNRIYTSNYLSLGERKTKIIGQVLCEVLTISLVAITLALFTGYLICGILSNSIIEN